MDFGFAMMIGLCCGDSCFHLGPFSSIWSFKRIIKASSIDYVSYMVILCLDDLELKELHHFQA